jgi:hypothetical protein
MPDERKQRVLPPPYARRAKAARPTSPAPSRAPCDVSKCDADDCALELVLGPLELYCDAIAQTLLRFNCLTSSGRGGFVEKSALLLAPVGMSVRTTSLFGVRRIINSTVTASTLLCRIASSVSAGTLDLY